MVVILLHEMQCVVAYINIKPVVSYFTTELACYCMCYQNELGLPQEYFTIG